MVADLSHNILMSASTIFIAPPIRRRILAIQAFTLAWMSVEAAVSLSAAWSAHSPALLGFGGDSVIELLSAAVVYWRFRNERVERRMEERAARIAGGLLFALAAFVLIASGSALLGYREVRASIAGIVFLLAAAFVMPWLAREKRHLSARTGSGSLGADAAESALCGYMAWIALVGLVVNAVWKIRWADPVAALCLIPIIVREAREATQGKPCRDC